MGSGMCGGMGRALRFVRVLTLCVGFGLGRAASGGCVRISWEAK